MSLTLICQLNKARLMSESKAFGKSFLTLFSGNVIAQILPFIFAPFLSRIFSEEDFAVQANFMAIVSLIAIVSGGRYEFAIVLPKLKEKALNLLMLAIRIAVVISILSLSIILFDDAISDLYNDDVLIEYLPLVSIGILALSLNTILVQWLVRMKMYREISTIKISQGVLINTITLVMGYMMFGVTGLILGWILGLVLTAAISFVLIKKSIDLSVVNGGEMKSLAKEYKDFPMINSLHAFTDLLFSQFILFAIITNEFGLLYLGLFFMMNKYLRAPIRVIGSAVGQIYYKEANERYINNESVLPLLFKSVKIVSVFAVPICLIILFFGPNMFAWYLGEPWRDSGVYAQIMALPILLNFLIAPITTTTLIFKKQKTAFLISLFGYTLALVALEIGVYYNWEFKDALILFAAAMSAYYLYLLFWYIYLTRKA